MDILQPPVVLSVKKHIQNFYNQTILDRNVGRGGEGAATEYCASVAAPPCQNCHTNIRCKVLKADSSGEKLLLREWIADMFSESKRRDIYRCGTNIRK